MSFNWNHKIELKDGSYLDELEKSRGIRIPSDLKAFIRRTNGANPDHVVCFDVNGTEHIYGATLDFGNTGEGDNAKGYFHTISDTAYFPFAIDSFGDLICYELNSGSIVFWDHENDKFFKTGKGLGGFISSLHDSKSEDSDGKKESDK